VGDQ
jgi:hypothetical protein